MRPLPLIAAAAALAALSPASGSAEADAKPEGQQCFYMQNWRGWRAIDRNAMYIRVGLRQVYRVDFANGCPGLTHPGARLITQTPMGQVCRGLDLDVTVTDQWGLLGVCIVQKVTPLSVSEVAAIPRNLTP